MIRDKAVSGWQRVSAVVAVTVLCLLMLGAVPAQSSHPEGTVGGWFPKKALVRVSLQTDSKGLMLENQYVPIGVSEVAEFDGVRVGDEGYVVSFIGGYVYDLDLKSVQATLRTVRGRSYPARALGVDERLRVLFLKDESVQPRTGFRLSQETESLRFKLAKIINDRFQVASPCIRSRDQITGSPFETLVVTDLTPTPAGWRGGTGVDLHGHWLGIITHYRLHKASRRLSVCQLLPAHVIIDALNKIRAGAERIPAGWLGVYLREDGRKTWISRVEESSPAAEAGLLPGDQVLRIDGYDFESAQELATAIRWKGPQAKCRLTVLRDQKEMDIWTTLAHRKMRRKTAWRMELPREPAPRRSQSAAGVQVYRTPLSALLTMGFAVKRVRAYAQPGNRPLDEGELMVTQVEPGSRAEAGGLQVGDIILSINNRSLNSFKDLELALEESSGQAVRVRLLRAGKTLETTINPD